MFLKSICAIVLLCMCLSITLFAKENPHSKESINILIQEIKRAPASEKRVKMNELKILLRSMNQKTRNEAMRNLQKSFAKHRPPKSSKSQTNAIKQYSNHNQPMRGMQNSGQGQHQGGRR